MRTFILLALVGTLTACSQPAPGDPPTDSVPSIPPKDHDAHAGCPPDQAEPCGLAPEGENNLGELKDLAGPMEATASDVRYNGRTGYLALPVKSGRSPGIVMIHEWWGLNANIKDMARMLASQGYAVLAVDLFGEVATTPERARELVTRARANQTALTENLRAAVAQLRSLPQVDRDKIGSIGWCFGGGQSLQLALSGEPMAATVLYYGNLPEDFSPVSSIMWPVLGIFAEKDQGIPPDAVRRFEAALNESGVPNTIIIYPDVGHAFANPSGQAYAPAETRDAWKKTLDFFERTMRH